MKRRSLLRKLWIAPILTVVDLPVHAQGSSPMASLFSLEAGSITPCFDEAHFADSTFDDFIYENIGLFIVAIIDDIKVGDANVWNVSVGPLSIPPQKNLYISRGFHLPASDPLDYSGSWVDITFIDGSVLTIPAINC